MNVRSISKRNNGTLLTVENLATHFFTGEGTVKAVQDVNFSIKKGKTFALVGESGCGKSVTALSIMRLVPGPQGKIVGGEIVFDGQNLLALSGKEMRHVRGNEISMIFQEPMTSLNPVYTVGNQIVEAIKLHQKKSSSDAWADAIEMLVKVGIADPEQRVREYPHQMSGGMRQRIMIAMAVSCEPALLIADEPTTALDVTIQAQILDLLDELQAQNGMSILLITHDLGVVAERAGDVAVMYASRIAEVAVSQDLYQNPLHPYTRALMSAIPQVEPSLRGRRTALSGEVPSVLNPPAGCPFHPRCPWRQGDCLKQMPVLKERSDNKGHFVACPVRNFAKGL